MLILVVKTFHVLAAVLFLGTGAGSAWYKLRASRSREVAVVAWCDAEVVFADWVFTVPSGVFVPASGLYLVYLYHLPLVTPWVWQGLLGYTIAGLTWLPAAFLQIFMRRISHEARRTGSQLPPKWFSYQRIWALLGVPSFSATMFVVWLMVSKQGLFE
jgi:uncharacterized membrane protein